MGRRTSRKNTLRKNTLRKKTLRKNTLRKNTLRKNTLRKNKRRVNRKNTRRVRNRNNVKKNNSKKVIYKKYKIGGSRDEAEKGYAHLVRYGGSIIDHIVFFSRMIAYLKLDEVKYIIDMLASEMEDDYTKQMEVQLVRVVNGESTAAAFESLYNEIHSKYVQLSDTLASETAQTDYSNRDIRRVSQMLSSFVERLETFKRDASRRISSGTSKRKKKKGLTREEREVMAKINEIYYAFSAEVRGQTDVDFNPQENPFNYNNFDPVEGRGGVSVNLFDKGSLKNFGLRGDLVKTAKDDDGNLGVGLGVFYDDNILLHHPEAYPGSEMPEYLEKQKGCSFVAITPVFEEGFQIPDEVKSDVADDAGGKYVAYITVLADEDDEPEEQRIYLQFNNGENVNIPLKLLDSRGRVRLNIECVRIKEGKWTPNKSLMRDEDADVPDHVGPGRWAFKFTPSGFRHGASNGYNLGRNKDGNYDIVWWNPDAIVEQSSRRPMIDGDINVGKSWNSRTMERILYKYGHSIRELKDRLNYNIDKKGNLDEITPKPMLHEEITEDDITNGKWLTDT